MRVERQKVENMVRWSKGIAKALARKEGERDALKSQVRTMEDKLEKLKDEREDCYDARAFLMNVASSTQKELEHQIADIASLAMETVFDDPNELKIEFVPKRGQSEAYLYFERNGHGRDPMTGEGGANADLAGFALRIAFVSLEGSRPFFLLDEPLKSLSKKNLPFASEFIRQLSERLDAQVLIITHEPALAEEANRVFVVNQENGESTIRIEKEN